MTRLRHLLLAPLLAFALLAAPVRAADMSALIQELGQQSTNERGFRMAFWIPPELLIGALPSVSPEQKMQIETMFRNHAMFMIAAAGAGGLPLPSALPKAEVMKDTFLMLADGARIAPLADDGMPSELKLLTDIFKPVLGSYLGQFGRMLEPVVFRVPDQPDGRPLSAGGTGRFSIRVVGQEFLWRLPLGSLLPPMFDPDTGDRFPGNWLFNPYTGRKLERR